MGRGRKQQADQRADLRGAGFIGLPIVVHKSEAYRSLSPFDRAVLTEIIAKFNGYNNGEIAVSHRQIADALGNSNYRKISKSIATLIERGLIDVSTEAVWKQRLAREYRLTFITWKKPPQTRPASNEYLSWQKYDADDVSAGKAQTADDGLARRRMSAADVSARIGKKRQNCVPWSESPADDVATLIVKPYGTPPAEGADSMADPYAEYWDDQTRPPEGEGPDLVRDDDLASTIAAKIGDRIGGSCEVTALTKGIARQTGLHPEWLRSMLDGGEAFPIHWDRLRAFWATYGQTA